MNQNLNLILNDNFKDLETKINILFDFNFENLRMNK